MKVLLLMGGISAEREVSLVSGTEVAKALRSEDFEVITHDAKPGRALFKAIDHHRPDVIFNALHGDWGEDGEVQSILDFFQIPYTHSGAAASRLAMDKHRAKEVLSSHGITVAQGGLYDRLVVARGGVMLPPYVVKPNGNGSSRSVYIIRTDEDPQLATVADDHEMGQEVLVERFVPGRELTVTVMDGRALAVTEIIPEGWYSYEEKYGANAARHVLPAQIPAEVSQLCLDWAKTAHHALGCRGLTRTDFRFDDTEKSTSRTMANRVVTLELNTQPGMTPTSLAPEQAQHVGMEFGALCRWIVEDASWPRLAQDISRGSPPSSRP